MKWTNHSEKLLLQRSFLLGLTGIILGTLSLLNTNLLHYQVPMGPINGVSLLLQLMGLSLAVLVLRKRKISSEDKEKAQKMVLVLGVALFFFVLSI